MSDGDRRRERYGERPPLPPSQPVGVMWATPSHNVGVCPKCGEKVGARRLRGHAITCTARVDAASMNSR